MIKVIATAVVGLRGTVTALIRDVSRYYYLLLQIYNGIEELKDSMATIKEDIQAISVGLDELKTTTSAYLEDISGDIDRLGTNENLPEDLLQDVASLRAKFDSFKNDQTTRLQALADRTPNPETPTEPVEGEEEEGEEEDPNAGTALEGSN